MSLIRNTLIRHLSYEQIDMLIRELAFAVKRDSRISSLYHTGSNDDALLVRMLSIFSGVPVEKGGKVFSLFSDGVVDICMFQKKYLIDSFNNDCLHFCEIIEQEDNEQFMRITLPWNK